MLKRDKNQLFTLIAESGLAVTQFELTEKETGRWLATTIQHRGTPLSFTIHHTDDSFHLLTCSYVAFAPSFPVETEYQEGPFSTVCAIFEAWLSRSVQEYLREQATPDLWANISALQIAELAEPQSGDDSALFSQAEIASLGHALRTFMAALSEHFESSEEQLSYVRQRLGYLEGALSRLNRTDWKGLALSSLVTIATTLSLSTEQGRQLAQLFRKVLIDALHLLP